MRIVPGRNNSEVIAMDGSNQSSGQPGSLRSGQVTRSDILQLIRQRDSIDETIRALGQILHSNNIGMTESLVDDEGYPRNDIDVYQVRHARHKIICLQNDFKSLTNEIEEKMELYHQALREHGAPPDMAMEEDEHAERAQPFAKVNRVDHGSPAFHAGLQVEDKIIKFGSVDSDNFQSLNDIGSIVQRSRGATVSVTVLRQEVRMKIALIPGEWQGRGLLGCNIIPYDGVDR